ncbi:MAG: acyl carrier protein [Lachnospiraceae bacterium]|nr:acyl carrier protein [Lachnospiraceae bacterium]
MMDQIKEIVAKSLGVDKDSLTAETSFKDDLGADSLDLFELVMALEEETGVEIPSEELENIKTIGDVEKYLNA